MSTGQWVLAVLLGWMVTSSLASHDHASQSLRYFHLWPQWPQKHRGAPCLHYCMGIASLASFAFLGDRLKNDSPYPIRPLSVCPVLSLLSLCDVGVLWPNGWMDQDETRHAGRPRPWPQCVRWGPSSPKKRHSPQFSAHFYYGQTAGCIRIPLGTEVGLRPGDIALHGEPALPPLKGHSPPIFGPCPLWPNCWMDPDATWYGSRPRPRRRCVRWGLSSPLKGAQPPPSFRPMSVAAKRLDG